MAALLFCLTLVMTEPTQPVKVFVTTATAAADAQSGSATVINAEDMKTVNRIKKEIASVKDRPMVIVEDRAQADVTLEFIAVGTTIYRLMGGRARWSVS